MYASYSESIANTNEYQVEKIKNIYALSSRHHVDTETNNKKSPKKRGWSSIARQCLLRLNVDIYYYMLSHSILSACPQFEGAILSSLSAYSKYYEGQY